MAVEEQTSYNTWIGLYGASWLKVGQRLIIANREVTKLGFWLNKKGSPTGNVTFEIRTISGDSLLLSKVWGDAGTLSTEITYREVTFDSPLIINEEVRIVVAFTGGSFDNEVQPHWRDSDVKADEYFAKWYAAGWTDQEGNDCAYRYTYEEPPTPAAGGGPASLVAAGII